MRLSGPLLAGATSASMNMEERVPIEAFAAERGIPASAVLSRIKSGIYSGVEEGGTWYVLRQKRAEELPVARPPNAPPVASPSEPVERITRITSRTFVRVLSVVLVVLIAVNFVTLVLGAWLSIVPIAVQAAVLLALRQRWPRARTVVRAWAAVLVVSGIAFLVAWAARLVLYAQGDPTAFSDAVPWAAPLQLGMLVGGVAVYVLSGRYIVTEEVPMPALGRTAVPGAS